MAKIKPPKLPKEVLLHLYKVYAEKAEVYDKLSRCEDYNNDILKNILKDVDFKNKVILDLGAGTGKFSIPLTSRAKLVYALDQSKPMIRILRRKIKVKKIKNIKILEAGFEKIPLPKESVDVILSVWTFPAHSKNWETDLKEVKRVLKKDGKIILVDSYYGSGEHIKIKKKTLKVTNPVLYSQLDKFSRFLHKWLISKGFKYKVINTLVNFSSKRNIEKLCPHFFGYQTAVYLLVRDKTTFNMKVSIFYGEK